MSDPALNLNGFTFAELLTSEGLERLDQTFLDGIHPNLCKRLLAYRNETSLLTPIEQSDLLIEAAKALEIFLIQLFHIEEAISFAEAKTLSNNPVSAFKKFFVLRRAKKNLLKADELPSFAELNNWLDAELENAPLKTKDRELAIALLANQYIHQPEKFENEIEQLTHWCVRALTSSDGKKAVNNWVSFKLPARIDYDNLIDCEKISDFRLRDGFTLTDERMNARAVQDEVNYCIYCHDHDGDFCSKGFPVKKNQPELGFKKNPLDLLMTGCPLEEKISEMNFLKRDGRTLAALAMVMVDNPMCPATGHRICNDCMKACIYQKQDPVNIPEIETRVLTDVLDLPWGVEIYDLLTRWNPLRQKQWVMKPYNNLKVMIAGMGPAGFTLAHHLLLEGFAVVGFDGLKIEPLPDKYINQPIYQFKEMIESLDERLISGFGGVAEYGITVRWDKNFLKLIYISLMRKPYFQVFGSTRFGGTITVHDAFEMGFDHFVVAVGAGLPKALNIPGSLAPGMRQANDFLMALQLGNAAKKNSLSALQIRLPGVVIGGGLTGVDTATEAQAYYITQVEKILARHEALVKTSSHEAILNELDPASKEALEECLVHGKAVRDERLRAKRHHEKPDFIKLIRAWGGITIVYRRTMQESPAYTHNHEEL
ncbi:MAG TPA: FAD-dependent oxidoreductase, partial [Gammaproteobacteria bacterium]|nr:FAD-dependent oxidoreductase [Gammaproteobacteria bacterium]